MLHAWIAWRWNDLILWSSRGLLIFKFALPTIFLSFSCSLIAKFLSLVAYCPPSTLVGVPCSYLAKHKDLHITCIFLILSTTKDCISFSLSMHSNNCSIIVPSCLALIPIVTNPIDPIEFLALIPIVTNPIDPIEFVGFFEGTKTF